MTLLGRFMNGDISDDQLLKEIIFLINATKNGLNLFTTESTDEKQQIQYCIPCGNDIETYGKTPGICYTEQAARDAILEMLNNYIVMLISWFKNDQEELDFTLKLRYTPVAIVTDDNGVQREIYDAIIKFKKCNNKIGFCINRVIPLIGKKEENK
jgi:hypothetical protein